MKVAICGIATESCTFSPLPTRLGDFYLTRAGDSHFAELYPFLPRFPGVDFSGAVTAKAMPGGPVETRAYNAIKSEILDRLTKLLPLDGVYLDMHGAMNVCGMDDAEGDFYAALRALVGPDCLLAASYDLHGNVSERIMDKLDIITGYRTAPHIDAIETRERAVRLLLRCLREGIRPRSACVYQAIAREIVGDHVMDATIQVGYVWADEPRMTACAIAIGRDIDAVSAAAGRLAHRYWKHRADFRFGVEAYSTDECIQRAMAQEVAPVFISDSGDNPTAGGVGDVTYFLERALAFQPPDLVYAAIADAEAVKRCLSAGAGADVKLEVGGVMDRRNARPLSLRGRVQFIRNRESNPQVVLKVGGIRVILTTKRTPFHQRQQFLDLCIVPEAHQIIAVKIGYLVPELKSMARKAYLALSPGAVNQDILSLPFKRITRPCYPFDADMIWTPRIQRF